MADVITALSTWFATFAGDILDFVVSLLPIVLPIIGGGVAIVFGIKWVKKLTNKAG